MCSSGLSHASGYWVPFVGTIKSLLTAPFWNGSKSYYYLNYGLLEISPDQVFTASVKDYDRVTQIEFKEPLANLRFDKENLRHDKMCLATNSKQELLMFWFNVAHLIVNEKQGLVFLVLAGIGPAIVATFVAFTLKISFRTEK